MILTQFIIFMGDVSVHNLELVDSEMDYLCLSVGGFKPLWREYVVKSGYFTPDEEDYPLESLFIDALGLKADEARSVARRVRGEVKSLLPCAMSVNELQSIIMNCIEGVECST